MAKGIIEITNDWKGIEDVPWDYNERALVSIFSGAIWRSGGYAMEEYMDEKRASKKRRIPPYGQRRLGLLFAVPGVLRSAEIDVEKQMSRWLGLMRNDVCDAAGWIFPAAAREWGSERSIHPGIAVFIKEILK